MAEHDALIFQYSHLHHLPREKEALHSLKKIASLVKPIMRARSWKVATLAEFYPDQSNLLGEYGIAPLRIETDGLKELTKIEAKGYVFASVTLAIRISFSRSNKLLTQCSMN